jgi:hypothetical protein
MTNPLLIGGVVDLLSKGLDKIFPDKAERERAKLALLQAQQAGELKELEISMSAIIAEANSSDPWTSRARPSFMYVMYILLLASLPMGVLSAFSPDSAKAIIAGYEGWLGAIPSDMWWLFGAGYLGYAGARTFEKKKGLAK